MLLTKIELAVEIRANGAFAPGPGLSCIPDAGIHGPAQRVDVQGGGEARLFAVAVEPAVQRSVGNQNAAFQPVREDLRRPVNARQDSLGPGGR